MQRAVPEVDVRAESHPAALPTPAQWGSTERGRCLHGGSFWRGVLPGGSGYEGRARAASPPGASDTPQNCPRGGSCRLGAHQASSLQGHPAENFPSSPLSALPRLLLCPQLCYSCSLNYKEWRW